MEKEIAALESDLETIERVARERYGMVKEKETVYMVYSHSPKAARERGP
jgi:cell division protein FtsB